VSSVVDSIAWFARLGWSKTFDCHIRYQLGPVGLRSNKAGCGLRRSTKCSAELGQAPLEVASLDGVAAQCDGAFVR
jgi:hypothetical protein